MDGADCSRVPAFPRGSEFLQRHAVEISSNLRKQDPQVSVELLDALFSSEPRAASRHQFGRVNHELDMRALLGQGRAHSLEHVLEVGTVRTHP